ncbi:NAD(P)-binding protein [Westerdykella ornata]|uniref:NAD(P)-binding protein n=1 Tax=Westerdykella ornata TaxID=318751 RepID=A0A6A6J8Z5_WESOR|nr:NAD(P)-binding protein [Westerdykella ornata]KAF2272872.1 NAD(P)-binding protein [Westerdykella ornata]
MGAGASFNPASDIPNLTGRIILVTGGSAGLGKQTIQYLAAHSPSRIYLAARTPSKAESAIASIREAVPDAPVEYLPLDLTSFSSIADAARAFKEKEKRLDILINNAGVMAMPYSLTKEGYEIQFGTNHMGHALLTKLLLPVLLETAKEPGADVRIVNLSSMGHWGAPSGGIIWDQKVLEQQYTFRRYGQSKLANVLFTKELAARYPQITSVAVHPGVIITDLYVSFRANPISKIGLWVYQLLTPILPGHFKDAKGGALTQTWAATVPKERLENGAFYRPVGIKMSGSRYAQDAGLAKKLWEWTEAEFQKHGY